MKHVDVDIDNIRQTGEGMENRIFIHCTGTCSARNEATLVAVCAVAILKSLSLSLCVCV